MSASFMIAVKFSDMGYPIEMMSFNHNVVSVIEESLDQSIITSDEIDTVVDITITKLNR